MTWEGTGMTEGGRYNALLFYVITGLDPVISSVCHGVVMRHEMPGSSPGMTWDGTMT